MIHAWTRHRGTFTRVFVFVMSMAGLWSLFSGLHLIVAGFDAKLLLSDIKFIFVAALPVAWLSLASAFTGIKLTPRMLMIISLLPVVTLGLIATNDAHYLFFEFSELLVTDKFATIDRVYGPWFWVHTLYSYLLVGIGVLLFVRHVFRSKGHIRSQALIMTLGSLTPMFFNGVYLSNPDLFLHLDLTPISFSLSGVFFFIGMFRYRMLDLMPIAREQIIRYMDDGVIVTDPRGLIMEANEVIGSMKSETGGKIIDMPVQECFPFLAQEWNAGAEKAGYETEIDLTTSTEAKWYALRMKHILSDEGITQGRLIFLRDITESKLAELQILESKRHLEELSRLKSAFLSNMSHDVRTPLSGIIGLADVLVEECEGDQQELAEMIRSSGDRLLKLLNSILSVSHLSSGKLDQNTEKTDVVELSRQVLIQFEREASTKELEFRMSLPSEAKYAQLDPNHLAHALTHLLDHSFRYTERGSIQFDMRTEMSEVVIRISDTGRGFESGFVESINQPLDTVSLAEFGLDKTSGLGLRVANGLLEELGGQLSMQSEPGYGSVFTIRFPSSDASASDSEESLKSQEATNSTRGPAARSRQADRDHPRSQAAQTDHP